MSIARGKIAATIPNQEDKKAFIAAQGKEEAAGRGSEGAELSTALAEKSQMEKKALGSYKEGGTIPKTGTYELHAGEKVTPASGSSAPGIGAYILHEGMYTPTHGYKTDGNEHARCIQCSWSGERSAMTGDAYACPDCGNGTTAHNSPSAREDGKVAAAFHEVYSNVPKNVKATGKTGKAKQKMMTAIALSKARRA